MKAKQFLFFIFISFQVYSQKLEVLIHKADSLYKLRDFSLALQYYSKAIKKDTTNGKLNLQRGLCFKYLDDNNTAIKDFSTALTKKCNEQDRLKAIYERGLAYQNLLDYKSALKDLSIYGCYNPYLNSVKDIIINYEIEISKIDTIIKIFEDVIYKNDTIRNLSFVYSNLADLNYQKGNYNESNLYLDKIKVEYLRASDNQEILESIQKYSYRKSLNYFCMDSFEKALEYTRSFTKLFPSSTYYKLNEVKILIYKKDFKSANIKLKAIEKEDSTIIDLQLHWGLYYQFQSKYKLAINSYSKEIEKHGDDIHTLRKIGLCYSKLNQFDKANNYYFKCLKIDSLNGSTLNSIAWNCFLQKKHQEGLPFAEKAIKMDSTDANYIDTKGCILYGMNKINESIECFNKAIDLESSLTNSYIYRARAYIKLNNKVKVCSDFNIASKLIQKNKYDYDYSDLKNYHVKYCK